MAPFLNHLVLAVSGPEPSSDEQRLLAFAEFMGVSTRTIAASPDELFFQSLIDGVEPGTCCLAMSAETLGMLAGANGACPDWHGFLHRISNDLLVFGWDNSPQQRVAISRLTRGMISGVASLPGAAERFSLPVAARPLSRHLAGLGFSLPCDDVHYYFELGDSITDFDVIMTANELPMFVRTMPGARQIFLLAGPLTDLDAVLTSEQNIDEHYVALIPSLIFFHHCFREACWHAPARAARVIIDDPLLAKRYGFLDLDLVIESMRRFRYAASIAFIPWNGWRTTRAATARIRNQSPSLSICIHGCDHSNREFQTTRQDVLNTRASLAMRRMVSLQARTELPFEPVMVFPQGRFSSNAISALRSCGYLAAVNSTCFPADGRPGDLTLRDLLHPAVTRYSGFPIFQRHYARAFFDLAFDLFLGKPVLIVGHHQDFRNGCGDLESIVSELNKREPNLSWPGLTDQLMHSCRQRILPDGSVEIEFYTGTFQVANHTPRPRKFLLRKHEPQEDIVQRVLLDGASVPFSFEKQFLTLQAVVEPRQRRTVRIVDREETGQADGAFSLAWNAGVLIRRVLSEFRDNTLFRHDRLLKDAKRIARTLKLTGDS